MSVEEISQLNQVQLFAALRNVEGDLAAQRDITQRVHREKLSKWKSDPRYAQSMAHHLVEDIHSGFRSAFNDVLQRSSDAHVNVSQFRRINSSLHHHHGIEDQWWFPRMIQQHPDIADEVHILENDHKQLVVLEERVCNGEFVALQEFVAALNDHLNREELLTVPLLMVGNAGM